MRTSMVTRRKFVKDASYAAGIAAVSGVIGCFDDKNQKEATVDMKFSELIEARRSVRKYAKGKIARDEMAKIVEEALMSIIAVGKSAQSYFKNPRKPVAEVLKVM